MPLRVLALGGMLFGLAAWCDETPSETEAARPVFPTPEIAFEVIRAAAKRGDWKTFHECLTQRSGDELTGQLISFGMVLRACAGVEKTGRIKKNQKQIEMIFARHGLTDEVLRKLKDDPERQRRLGQLVRDQGMLCAELIGVVQAVAQRVENSPFADAELREVTITGDRATGTMVVTAGGKERQVQLGFVKSEVGWRVETPKK